MKGKKKKVEGKIGEAGAYSVEITDDLYLKGELKVGEKVDLVALVRQLAEKSGVQVLKDAVNALGATVGR